MQPKRDTNDVLSAIGQAKRAGRGQILADMDPEAIAADAEARSTVTVQLRGYEARGLIGANDIAEAEHKYRIATERLLGGPQPLCAALAAAEAAREQPLEELPAKDQALLRKWSGGAVQLRSEGIENLPPVTSTAAWFDIKVVRRRDDRAGAARMVEARRPAPLPVAAPPGQGVLF